MKAKYEIIVASCKEEWWGFRRILHFWHYHHQGVSWHAASVEAVWSATVAYKLLSLSSQLSDYLNWSCVMLQNFQFSCVGWNKREHTNWIVLTYHRRNSLLKFLYPNPRWPHSGCIADSMRFYSSHVTVKCVVLVCLNVLVLKYDRYLSTFSIEWGNKHIFLYNHFVCRWSW